ncbi:MAG: hypothetical protein CMJ94_08970 [Planctomycetes bacterium]|nr:hypothetical protein [Planctomycetota bacterium]
MRYSVAGLLFLALLAGLIWPRSQEISAGSTEAAPESTTESAVGLAPTAKPAEADEVPGPPRATHRQQVEPSAEDLNGVLLLGVLPSGEEVTPTRVDGYRGAQPRVWLPGPGGLRIVEEEADQLFFAVQWTDEKEQDWIGEGWFPVQGVERVVVPLQQAQLRLTGTVRRSGVPEAGSHIHASDGEARFATLTNARGEFRFLMPRAASVLVRAGYIHAPGAGERVDLSDGKDRYVELELPPGSLTVRVIPPEGVEIPTQLAVGLHPVDPLEARSRDHLKFAPIRDGELAQFDSVPAGEYVLRVGEEIFQPFLLKQLGCSPAELPVVITDEHQTLEVRLPRATTVTITATDPRSGREGVIAFVSYERIDQPLRNPASRGFSTDGGRPNPEGKLIAPGEYRFHVGGNGFGFTSFEGTVVEGEENVFDVELSEAGLSIGAELGAGDWEQIDRVLYLDETGRQVGMFTANIGARTGFTFRDADGNESEPIVHDSSTPRPVQVHVPQAGEYRFLARLRSSRGYVDLGRHRIDGSISNLFLKLPN